MKILILSTHPLFDNRIKKHIKTLLKGDFKVTYLNSSISKIEEFELEQRINLIHYNISYDKKSIFKFFFVLHQASKLIKNEYFNIIHVHDPIFLIFSKTAFKNGAKVVFDKHEYFEKIADLNAKVATFIERLYSKYINGVVFVTNGQLEYILKLGIKRYQLIPNYQSSEEFSKQRNTITKKSYIQVVYIGDLSESTRNINLMLMVMDIVLSQSDKVTFILGGENQSLETHKLINELKRKHTKFKYIGKVKYSEVINITTNSDIGLYFSKKHPNNFKSSPNKIYEYLISGIAIIGMGEFMQSDEINNNCGLIFDYNDELSFISSQFISLINDLKKLKELQRKSKIIGKNYTWESIENNYFKIYDEITEVKGVL